MAHDKNDLVSKFLIKSSVLIHNFFLKHLFEGVSRKSHNITTIVIFHDKVTIQVNVYKKMLIYAKKLQD